MSTENWASDGCKREAREGEQKKKRKKFRTQDASTRQEDKMARLTGQQFGGKGCGPQTAVFAGGIGGRRPPVLTGSPCDGLMRLRCGAEN